MKNVFKKAKKAASLCLVAAMLCTPMGGVSAADTKDKKWKLANQDWGDEKTVTVFGANNVTAHVAAQTDKDKNCYGVNYSANDGCDSSGKWLVIDVNLATNTDTSITARGAQDRHTSINGFSVAAGKWHSVRLAIKDPNPNNAATSTTETTKMYSEHKLYVDGKCVFHYDPSNFNTETMNYLVYDKGNKSDSETKWYIRFAKKAGAEYINYAEGLRISTSETEPDGGTIPTLSTTEKYIVSKNYIIGNDIYLSDLAKDGLTITATRAEAEGEEKAVEDTLKAGDTVLVKNSENFVNTYTVKNPSDKNVLVENNTYDGLKSLQNSNNGTTTSVSGEYGKENTDTSSKVILKNDTTSSYINLTAAKADNIIGGGYFIFEANVKPSDKLEKVYLTSEWSWMIGKVIAAEQMYKNCWNKIVWIVDGTNKDSDGKYLVTIYLNGKVYDDTTKTTWLLGDTVTNDDDKSANSTRQMQALRLCFGCSEKNANAGIFDDVKVYETWTKPEVSEYTAANGDNVVFDGSVAYVRGENAADTVATACSATKALSGNDYVIVNRGDETYSRYDIRAFGGDAIYCDSTSKEFWTENATDGKLIAVQYSDGKLVSAEILEGTSIGGKVVKAAYTTNAGNTTKLYYWDMRTLQPLTASKTVE